MKPSFWMALWLGLGAGAAAGAAEPTAGPCGANETAYFACPVARGRWVGLCGAAPKALQYRFGPVGAPELQFPADAATGPAQMRYAHYSRYQTERVEISFVNLGVQYVVFDYTEDGRRRAGVRVIGTDEKEREVACVGRVHSRLADLDGVLACDADNALNGGACR